MPRANAASFTSVVLTAAALLLPACYAKPTPLEGTDDGSSSDTGSDAGSAESTSDADPETGASTGTPEPGAHSGCIDASDCDDGDPCTDDACAEPQCVHTPRLDDPACACTTVEDCSDLPEDNECRSRRCDDGVCGLNLVPAGTPLGEAQQIAEDCLTLTCDGAGEVELVPEALDIPDDGLECTQDTCEMGTPLNEPVPEGTTCIAGSCDATGSCVGCLTAADCGGETTFCHTVTCDAGVCGVEETEAGTLLPSEAQTEGDCVALACDGVGNAAPTADDDDLPADDGNECTQDICVDGTAQHPAAAQGSACETGFCDGIDSCVECTTAAQCPAVTGNCLVPACIENVCGAAAAAEGTACDDGFFCTATDTCDASGACVGADDPCPDAGDGDCSSSCDEATGTCTANDPAGSACDDGLFCTAIDTCNGSGFCSGVGTPCPGADFDADCSETCSESTDSCTANDPNGSACNGCGGCISGTCVMGCPAGQVCCDPPGFQDFCGLSSQCGGVIGQ